MPAITPTLSEAEYLDELNDLILYVTGLEQERLFRGNQSREVLPNDGTYIIYTPIVRKRIGTNITSFDAENVDVDKNGAFTDSLLVQVDAQIDVYGDEAMEKAQGLELFAHSPLCRAWLVSQGFGIRVMHSTAPQDTTFVGDTKQYIPRQTITFSLCFGTNMEIGQPWYEDVLLKGTHIDPSTGKLTPPSEAGIVDVDAYFKP